MAEKSKKPKFSFKELPVYCKVLRIVAAVLMAIGAVWLIIAAIVTINNSYAFGLYFGALGFLIPACVAAIVEFVLEKKWAERKMAQGDVPEQVEEKKEGEAKPESDNNEVWFCPECGHKNTGEFCPECGTKKPECVSSSKEETPVVEEHKDELETVDPARAESHSKLQKILNIAIPLGTVGIIALWFVLASLISVISHMILIFEYLARDNPGEAFVHYLTHTLWFGLFIYATAAVTLIITLIHLTSKFNAIKAFKFLPFLPVLGLSCLLIEWFAHIFWSIGVFGEYSSYGLDIASIVFLFLAIGLCVVAIIISIKQKGTLFSKIFIAVAFGMSAIALFIEAGAIEGAWFVDPAIVALGIFLMLAAAGNFFIKPKE